MFKKRKIVSVLLAIITVFGVFTSLPFSASAVETNSESVGETYTSGDFEYEIRERYNYDTEQYYEIAVITDYNGTDESVSVPSQLGGCNVTDIGDGAFSDCTSLTSITIPNGVTSIGWNAFSDCTSLTSVVIPDGVTSIDDSTFYGCTSLTSITIPDSVTSIGQNTFYDCTSLTNVVIPDSVTSIGNSAFSGCTSLTNVVIPNSVTVIERGAFCGCTSLSSIEIPDSVTEIRQDAFSGCKSLKEIVIPNSVTWIGYSAFSGCTSLTSVVIPDGVTSIDDSTFDGCTSLASITIPDSVTSIGEYAFYGCTSLTNVVIPDSVKSISSYGGGAFVNCPNLKCVTVPSSVERIGEYSFGYNGCSYYDSEKGETVDNFTILGKSGTAAETYANENGFTFIDLDNKNYNHTDNNSGIGVIAKADAELVVKEISDKENLDKIKSLFDNNKSILNVYDITLSKNGKKVQHEGMAEVSIPCKDENAKVYRVESDNTLTDMQAVYKDGYLKFYTEHFSDYVVASPRKSVLGDINNDSEVNAKDRMMLTRHLAKWTGYENIDMTAADVNNDGEVNAKDRMVLTRHLAKWQGYETLPFDKF